MSFIKKIILIIGIILSLSPLSAEENALCLLVADDPLDGELLVNLFQESFTTTSQPTENSLYSSSDDLYTIDISRNKKNFQVSLIKNFSTPTEDLIETENLSAPPRFLRYFGKKDFCIFLWTTHHTKDQAFERLTKTIPTLEKLILHNFDLRPVSLKKIIKSCSPKTVKIENCTLLNRKKISKPFKSYKDFSYLDKIDIVDSVVSVEGIKTLSYICQNIRRFSVLGGLIPDNSFLFLISSMPFIQKLIIGETSLKSKKPLEYEAIEFIINEGDFPYLTHLSLDGMDLTQYYPNHFFGIKNLQQLKTLSLIDNSLTDSHLQSLSTLDHLVKLDLQTNCFTLAGVENFLKSQSPLSKLEELNLVNSKQFNQILPSDESFTEEEKQHLLKLYPNLNIIIEEEME